MVRLLYRGAVGLLLALAAKPQTPEPAGLIRVEVTGLRNDKGQVVCALFSSPGDFPKKTDKAVAQANSGISQGQSTCEFERVAPGTYAVSVFHDENSNGKLDTKLMGLPREGVRASNNAKGRFGPPKFEDASFHFTGGKVELKITVTYL